MSAPLNLTSRKTVWATDCWSKTGRAHLWYVGDRFAVTLCGQRNQYVSDLQPESDNPGRCKKCQAVEVK